MRCSFVGKDGNLCGRETQYKWELCESHYNRISPFQRKVASLLMRPGVKLCFTEQFGTPPKMVLNLQSGLIQVSVLLECFGGEKLVSFEEVCRFYGLLKSLSGFSLGVAVAEKNFGEEARDFAKNLPDLKLFTLEEVMSSLISFDQWLEKQKEQLLVVFSKEPFLSPSAHLPGGKVVRLLEHLENWLEEEGSLVVVVGEEGAGKTFLLKRLAFHLQKRWEEKRQRRIPLYLSLSHYTKTEEEWESYLLRQVSQKTGTPLESYSTLQRVMENGQLVFLLDHLGELYRKIPFSKLEKLLEKVFQLAVPKNKVILSLWQGYVYSQELPLPLEKKLKEKEIPILPLQPWNRLFKSKFLEVFFHKNVPDSLQNLVFSPSELQELSQSPLWLSLASHISPRWINQLSQNSKAKDILSLYLKPYLEEEKEGFPKQEERLRFLLELALEMAEEDLFTLSKSRFMSIGEKNISDKRVFQNFWTQVPFLAEEDGEIGFSHRLFLDYFVASYLAEREELFHRFPISSGTAWWLAKFWDTERKKQLFEKLGELGGLAKRNALLTLYFAGESLEEANLEGAHLDYLNLEGVQLRKANLKGASLRGVNLVGANLKMANLEGADLSESLLYQVSLVGAKLDNTNLDGADFGSTNLDGVDLRRAKIGHPEAERKQYLRRLGALV